MAALRSQVRGFARALGWEVHRFDPDESLGAYLSTLLPALGVNCVLDVGARVGQFGELLRARGYRGRIVSFEPVSRSLYELRRRARGDPDWQVIPVALGRRDGEAAINVTRDTQFASFLRPNDAALELTDGSGVAGTERVPVRRLDDLFATVMGGIEHPRVFLKLDTQGWDLEVLRGATDCLDPVVALQTELSVRPLYDGMPTFQESLAELTRAGFAVSAMYTVTRDAHLRLVELDCVMVRDDARQRPTMPDDLSSSCGAANIRPPLPS